MASGNCATWQHSQLSNWQRGKWQVEMWRSSGDVPLRVALVIRQQVAKKRLAASSNVPRWQPTNEVKHQAPLMMSPTHRLGVKIVAAFGQLIATRHWANKLIRGKSSVQAQQRETTRLFNSLSGPLIFMRFTQEIRQQQQQLLDRWPLRHRRLSNSVFCIRV